MSRSTRRRLAAVWTLIAGERTLWLTPGHAWGFVWGMKRYLWAFCLSWSVWSGFAASARAGDIHVCVRPPDVPVGVGRWAYDAKNKQVIVKSAEEFRTQSQGLTVYVYDAAAPPESVSLLPARHQHLTCPRAKPSPQKPPPAAPIAPAVSPKPPGHGRTGTGQGGASKGAKGEKMTAGEKVAAELAIVGAIATGQMNEDLAEKEAERLAQRFGLSIADALNKNGSIGPYKVLAKFTAGLGGRFQAHHILEKRMFGQFKFPLKKSDLAPSVILTDIEHKAITADLKVATAAVETKQQLWQAYQRVYKKYPHWLKAIEPYFATTK